MTARMLRPRDNANLPASVLLIDRVLTVIERCFTIIAAGILVLLVSNTFLNALGRTFLGFQIPGSLNITIVYFMPALVFLGLVVVQARGSHIAATVVVERFGPTGSVICHVFVSALIVVSATTMAVGAAGELDAAWNRTLGGSPPLPVGPSWIFVPLGLGVLALRALVQLVELVYTARTQSAQRAVQLSDASSSKERAADSV